MLRHIVSWKLSGADVAEVDAQVRRITGDLESLDGVIPEIISIRVVRNMVHSGQNFDAAVIADFDDATSLIRYLEHPAHVAAASYLKSVTEVRACVDYEV